MSGTTDILDTEPLRSVLTREFERSQTDRGKMAAVRERIDAGLAAGENVNDLFPKDVYLNVEEGMGRFLYLATKADNARTIVEFGTSFGISTLYLAAAASQTGGRVIGSELEEQKATRAKANLKEAGLARFADVRVGDALETLKDIEEPVDLLFLDGWKDLYLPVLEMMIPKLRPGALVLADNIYTFKGELQPYVDRVSQDDGPFRSLIVPFESGLAMSRYLPDGLNDEKASWPHWNSGELIGIARKEKRRADVETLNEVAVTVEGGLEGDSRGRFTKRAVTVLAQEAWEAAMSEMGLPPDTDWTIRRANMLTRGVELPRAAGGVIIAGGTVLEVTGETRPCSRMEEQQSGLLKALAPDWRGGVTCRVLQEGSASTGDSVQTLISPPERKRAALPG